MPFTYSPEPPPLAVVVDRLTSNDWRRSRIVSVVPLTIHEEDAIIIYINDITHFGVYDYWLTGLTACDSWLVDSWLVVLNLVGSRYRPIVLFITNEKIIVTLNANSIAEALYKNKYESSELWQEQERSLSTAVFTAGQTMTELEKQWGCVSEVG